MRRLCDSFGVIDIHQRPDWRCLEEFTQIDISIIENVVTHVSKKFDNSGPSNYSGAIFDAWSRLEKVYI